MYLISFIEHLFMNFFLVHKTAYKVKSQKNVQNFFKKFAFYGLDMELEP